MQLPHIYIYQQYKSHEANDGAGLALLLNSYVSDGITQGSTDTIYKSDVSDEIFRVALTLYMNLM